MRRDAGAGIDISVLSASGLWDDGAPPWEITELWWAKRFSKTKILLTDCDLFTQRCWSWFTVSLCKLCKNTRTNYSWEGFSGKSGGGGGVLPSNVPSNHLCLAKTQKLLKQSHRPLWETSDVLTLASHPSKLHRLLKWLNYSIYSSVRIVLSALAHLE